MFQEVDISMVSHLHLGTPAAHGRDADWANGCLDSTANLSSNTLPLLSHPNHTTGIHHSITRKGQLFAESDDDKPQNLPKRVTIIPADTVNPPIRGPQVCHVTVPDSDMLDITPV